MAWSDRYPVPGITPGFQTQTPLESSPLGKAIDATPGLLMILGGLALIAMAALTPAWLQLDQLDAQRQQIAQQADALDQQKQRYLDFHQALRANDPVLLERLAYTQLRREPQGRSTVTPPRADANQPPAELPPGDIDQWLRVEPIAAANDALLAQTPDTRLTRLAGGPLRFILLLAGCLCLVAGLWWGPKTAHNPQPQPAHR